MRSNVRFLAIFMGLWTLMGCGDDVVVKPISDVFSGATDDVQVAADTADDATATAGDVTSTGDSADAAPDADATTTPDAATAETSDDAAADGDVSLPDADAAADSAEPADAAADATPVTDDAAGTDATADDDAVTDVADAADVGADAADGALSDTWTPCTSGVSCEDGDPCTVDLCWDISCQHVAIVACAGPLAPCDPLHACAAGVCDPVRNACVP